MATALVGVLATGVAALGNAADATVESASSIAPTTITAGRNGSYSVSYTNTSGSAFSGARIAVRLPGGATLVSSNPAGCTANGGDVVCAPVPFGNGATVTQELVFTSTATGGDPSVFSMLTVDAAPGGHAHRLEFAAPEQSYSAEPLGSDIAGGCLVAADGTLSTNPDLSSTNRQVTAATVPVLGGPGCIPVVLGERERLGPADSCPDGVHCSTEISFTSARAVPPETPILLTFTLDRSELPAGARARTFRWYKDAALVPDCLGRHSLPSGRAACITARSTTPAHGIELDVLWNGADPSWTG